MTGGSRIFAVGAEASQPATDEAASSTAEAVLELTEEPVTEWESEEEQAPARGLLFPVLIGMAVIGWTAFYAWANQWVLAGITPQEGITLLVNWCIPVLLIGLVCQMFLRNGHRAARRFGDTARLLADESSRLEERLTVVNRELSLAREFLGAQSRDLESLGRVATEKLSTHADRLQELVRDNGSQVESIALVSTNALENMERLRGQLPVIASSAKDVANNIANAGRTAQTQIDDMVSGFERLNEFGQSSEAHVDAMGEKARDTVEELKTVLEQFEARVAERFTELEARSSEFRTRLDSDEIAVLASVRSRSAELLTELETTRSTLDSNEVESLTSLRARLGALRDESAALGRSLRESEATAIESLAKARERLEENVRDTLTRLDVLDQQTMEASRSRVAAISDEASQFDERLAERNKLFTEEAERRRLEAESRHGEAMERIGEHLGMLDATLAERHAAQDQRLKDLALQSESLLVQLTAAGDRVAKLSSDAGSVERSIGASLESLGNRLAGGREALGEVSLSIGSLTDESVRLLELLQASSKQGREVLPEALANGSKQLEELERRVAELGESMMAAAHRSDALAEGIGTTRTAIAQSLGEIGALQAGLEQGAGRHGRVLADLKTTLETLDNDSARLATFARDEMAGTFESLTEATRQALAALEAQSSSSVVGMAEKLAEEGAAALDKVMRARTEQAISAIDESAERAAENGRETARTLRDQLTKIDELAGNLEQRVAQARQKAEEQIDNDFSRRVALITESLNSNAIDIAKALSSDVTDSAWAAYLRGDRGVFTRRAVRLLDGHEVRSIAQIFGEDGEFREHVSRYIHDFESMLRQLLSTRDGHALSVTLLSSDMGKLYVALAQAIERLRT